MKTVLHITLSLEDSVGQFGYRKLSVDEYNPIRDDLDSNLGRGEVFVDNGDRLRKSQKKFVRQIKRRKEVDAYQMNYWGPEPHNMGSWCPHIPVGDEPSTQTVRNKEIIDALRNKKSRKKKALKKEVWQQHRDLVPQPQFQKIDH